MLAKVLDYRRYFPILSFLFLYQTARGMSLPLLPQDHLSIKFSAIDIGLAFAAYSISFLIFEALWGFVFEKFGTKGSMPPLAISLTAVGMLLFSRPSGLTEVIGFMVIFGIGLGGAGVFPRLVIAHLTQYSDRGRAYGVLGFTYSIGATVGSLLGGVAGVSFWNFKWVCPDGRGFCRFFYPGLAWQSVGEEKPTTGELSSNGCF